MAIDGDRRAPTAGIPEIFLDKDAVPWAARVEA